MIALNSKLSNCSHLSSSIIYSFSYSYISLYQNHNNYYTKKFNSPEIIVFNLSFCLISPTNSGNLLQLPATLRLLSLIHCSYIFYLEECPLYYKNILYDLWYMQLWYPPLYIQHIHFPAPASAYYIHSFCHHDNRRNNFEIWHYLPKHLRSFYPLSLHLLYHNLPLIPSLPFACQMRSTSKIRLTKPPEKLCLKQQNNSRTELSSAFRLIVLFVSDASPICCSCCNFHILSNRLTYHILSAEETLRRIAYISYFPKIPPIQCTMRSLIVIRI